MTEAFTAVARGARVVPAASSTTLDEAAQAGTGAVTIDGVMIDRAMADPCARGALR